MYKKMLKLVERSLLALVVFAIGLILYMAIVYPMIIESKAEMGMTKAEVLSKLEGKNYSLTKELHLCKNNLWSGDCDIKKIADSEEFLVMKIGIDVWFVVGFSKSGLVNYKSIGQT